MKRILTAIVALPVLLYTVWSEIPYFFVALTYVAILLALGEFYNLASKVGCRPQIIPGYAAALLVVACFVYDEPVWVVAVISALVVVSLAAALARPDEMNKSLASVSATLFGVAYVALLASFLVGVRMIQTPESRLASKLLTMFFAMVMMTDTGAYYTGRSIGRHKLAPRVSPGKTVEGAIGGLIAAVITGPLCRWIFFPEIHPANAMALGATIGVLGQVGDLAESMLKRGSGVKDSGNLLPGHGGMLDRVDSILFCAPLLYYYSRFFL
ncbi:MAG TPA: phosphatidate cytidylyltransferase [Blastocatellia bacterium]|jgi:phosphatidate cytidylyltransferase|nr:phosphatidate cytidylyltransferase [Blastocatellia bacterium]